MNSHTVAVHLSYMLWSNTTTYSHVFTVCDIRNFVCGKGSRNIRFSLSLPTLDAMEIVRGTDDRRRRTKGRTKKQQNNN